MLTAETFPYFEFILSFCVIEHLFITYVDYRQHQKFKETKVPIELSKYVTESEFIHSQTYNLAKSNFEFISGTFDFALSIATLVYGGLPWLWGISEKVLVYFGYDTSYEILQSLVFFNLYQIFSVIYHLPVQLYSTFILEEDFGFNKQTLTLFFIDMIKTNVLVFILGTPILSGVILVIQWGGEFFWFYLWVFLFAFIMITVTIYPILIAPLFNKFTELPEGELRSEINALAERVKFPLTKLYLIDGSKRSAHSNAYFYGFFKNKRIVIYDTLIEQVSTKGIVAIVGHELGHYKLNHPLKNIVIVQFQLIFQLYVFGQFINNDYLYQSFGFETKPILIGLSLFSLMLGPMNHVVSLSMNYLSRTFEYQADRYATDLGFDLTEPLAAIHIKNASNLNPDSLYSALNFSHPTLLERIKEISLRKSENEKKK